MWGGGVWLLSPCFSPPALPSLCAALPYSPFLSCGSYPLGWAWLGWARLVVSAMVCWFFPVGRRGLGFSWGGLGTGVHAWCAALCVRCPWPLGACSPVCTLGVLCCVCGVLGHLAPVHRCARLVCCAFGVLGHLAPVHWCARVVCCVCGVPGRLALVHRCARSLCCVVRAVSLAAWCSFTGVLAWCVVLCVWCPWPLGACSPVCSLGVLCVRCPWPLGTCSPACSRGVLRVWCPWPLGACAPVCALVVLRGVCGVLGRLALVHRCACLVCGVVCVVSLATWCLFTGVHVRCVVCVVSLATWRLFTGVHVRCAVCVVSLATWRAVKH